MLQGLSFHLFKQSNIKSIIFLIGLLSVFESSATLKSSDALLQKNQTKHYSEALIRIKQLQQLIQTSKFLSEKEKLIQVNNFFNQQISFANDINLWGVKDYWATPYEVLSKGAGDCEDYSIAKYYSLIKLGVPEHKLRITYVKALKYNQAHMVLSYFSHPHAIPTILDNLIPDIISIKQRQDLLPFFSFNDSGVWLASTSHEKKLKHTPQLFMWEKLKHRI